MPIHPQLKLQKLQRFLRGRSLNIIVQKIIYYFLLCSLLFKEKFPFLAQEVLQETLTEQTRTFEEFLIGFLRNRADFVKANKEIFQVVFKELIYRDDFKNELVPYIAKQAPSILINVINEFKERDELIDLPTNEIFHGLFTVLGGFFVTRFVLMNNYDITDEDIKQLVDS